MPSRDTTGRDTTEFCPGTARIQRIAAVPPAGGLEGNQEVAQKEANAVIGGSSLNLEPRIRLVIVIPTTAILTVAIQRFVRRFRRIASAGGAVCVCCAGAVSEGSEFDFGVRPLLAVFGSFLGFAMPWRRL